MKLRPLHDRVIVKRLEQETKTASGIVIPDNAAEKPDQGEVLAVGPGKRNDKGDFIALNVAVGDRTTLNELFAAIRQSLADNGIQYTKTAQYADFRAGDVRHSQADISKAQRLLGYTPEYRIRDGLQLAMPWYIAQQ